MGSPSYTVLLCVTLCYRLTNYCLVNSLCVTLCYGITSGPFDQEVISSSLTLEDPDLKVRESSSFVSMPSDLTSQDPALCDKKSHLKHQTLF